MYPYPYHLCSSYVFVCRSIDFYFDAPLEPNSPSNGYQRELTRLYGDAIARRDIASYPNDTSAGRVASVVSHQDLYVSNRFIYTSTLIQ